MLDRAPHLVPRFRAAPTSHHATPPSPLRSRGPAPLPAECRRPGLARGATLTTPIATTPLARILARLGSGAPGMGVRAVLPHRAVLERVFGVPLSGVPSVVGATVLGELGIAGVEAKSRVAFADEEPDLQSAAHEVVHWLQRRRF